MDMPGGITFFVFPSGHLGRSTASGQGACYGDAENGLRIPESIQPVGRSGAGRAGGFAGVQRMLHTVKIDRGIVDKILIPCQDVQRHGRKGNGRKRFQICRRIGNNFISHYDTSIIR